MKENFSSTQSITQILTSIEQEQFTGWLDAESATGLQWRVYICLSRLLWADGGTHPHRSWRRLLAKYAPKLNLNQVKIDDADQYECWNYYVLTLLLKRNLIEGDGATALIQNKITEVILDILHEEESGEELNYTLKPESTNFLMEAGLKVSVSVVTIKQALFVVKQERSAWCQRGFSIWSPNLSPIIKDPAQLQKAVSTIVYQNFTRLFNGKLTLRDLALQMNKDVVLLTASISTYVLRGWLDLLEVPDLPPHQTPLKPVVKTISQVQETAPTKTSSSSTVTVQAVPSQPLIVCIDDSPQIHQIMQQILTLANYRFLAIQDALQAVPTLIASSPDFVFLDLGMPILNGYEICAQIRRVTKLQNIPVVILTSNDGIVDRMRSRVVGASGFLGKPIVEDKVISMVKKFLGDGK